MVRTHFNATEEQQGQPASTGGAEGDDGGGVRFLAADLQAVRLQLPPHERHMNPRLRLVLHRPSPNASTLPPVMLPHVMVQPDAGPFGSWQ